jgi:hypothetical protein
MYGPSKEKAAPLKTCNTSHLHGKKVQDVYTQMYMVHKTMFSSQTSQFPIQSFQSNKYTMVMVEINSNTILVKPMKNRKDARMIRAYNALLLQLKRFGIVSRKQVLDNGVSENMKNHICDKCKQDIELVPQGCHRCNTAEVAIHNFKANFLSVLAGVANNFSPNFWDQLLPWQSNATPKILAYVHLSGPFDYNKMPLAPMGCEAQVHEKTIKCSTWAYHSVNGWYSSHCQNIITHIIAISNTQTTIQYGPTSTQMHHLSLHNTHRQSDACTGRVRQSHPRNDVRHQKLSRHAGPITYGGRNTGLLTGKSQQI